MFVSIIMPAFNAGKYIEESIVSVMKQTWQNWELLIIDDCSKDHTADVVKKYIAVDKRISLLSSTSNQGVAASRNRGVQEAHGEWIAFLDSDDLWAPDKLTLQLNLINSQKALFVFTGSAFIDGAGYESTFILHVPNRISYRELLKQNLISCSSVLIYRELLLSHPMKTGNIHEDFVAWLTILRDMDIIAYGIDQPLLIYRFHTNSKSGKKWKAAIMNWNAYRKIGLNYCSCCYYQTNYVFRNLLKYINIFKK